MRGEKASLPPQNISHVCLPHSHLHPKHQPRPLPQVDRTRQSARRPAADIQCEPNHARNNHGLAQGTLPGHSPAHVFVQWLWHAFSVVRQNAPATDRLKTSCRERGSTTPSPRETILTATHTLGVSSPPRK